ncbi:hypothetical protein SmJEL517_g01154 [Synchytrium microbalum]|uniref:Uncharacterized protein n=1 Tax=Synchytrium microbalum TaxID=1806994 RepID=A0A507CAH4_9FUNG|nr:uncharacterized protein SmJEL517_g01154 [Synchytrium microbalum]TPX36612.1 hypothetical protein SmJEL517_g01154 [Synchytrium microbalum]
MVRYLKEEQSELRNNTPGTVHAGPCLEFLLEMKILDELVAYAQSDTPIGMRAYVVKIFQLLISDLGGPQLLPETSVRTPLTRLIAGCHQLVDEGSPVSITSSSSEPGTGSAGDVKHELVNLIALLFRHIQTTPSLLGLFFERSKTSETSKFSIFDTLLDYVGYPSTTGRVAREAIITALSILGDQAIEMEDERNKAIMVDVVEYVVDASQISETLAERQAILYTRMTSLSSQSTNTQNEKSSPPRGRLIPESDKLTVSLVDRIDTIFFKPVLFQSIASHLEISLSATLHLADIIRSITPQLLAPLSLGILVYECAVEDGAGRRRLLDLLLSRIEAYDRIDLAISTLRLLDVVISSYHPHVLKTLLNVKDVDDDGSTTDEQIQALHSNVERLLSAQPPDLMNPSTATPTSTEEFSSLGYDEHFDAAHRRVFNYIRKRQGWRRTSIRDTTDSGTSIDTDISSGLAFRHLLIQLLRQMLELPPNLNLVLTSCIARIAVIGGSGIDEFLFKSGGEEECVADILAQVLSNPKLSKQAQQRVSTVTLAVIKMRMIRERGIESLTHYPPSRRMSAPSTPSRTSMSDPSKVTPRSSPPRSIPAKAIGDDDIVTTDSVSDTRPPDDSSTSNSEPIYQPAYQPTAEEANFLASYLILSEFIKELAAIVLNRGAMGSMLVNDVSGGGEEGGWGGLDRRQQRALSGYESPTRMKLPDEEMEDMVHEAGKFLSTSLASTVGTSYELLSRVFSSSSGSEH